MVSYRQIADATNQSTNSLNPYCSGRWSRTDIRHTAMSARQIVLILIVVEDGLVLWQLLMVKLLDLSLNPYCSGRWSRT